MLGISSDIIYCIILMHVIFFTFIVSGMFRNLPKVLIKELIPQVFFPFHFNAELGGLSITVNNAGNTHGNIISVILQDCNCLEMYKLPVLWGKHSFFYIPLFILVHIHI